jgi:hypothetical protein
MDNQVDAMTYSQMISIVTVLTVLTVFIFLVFFRDAISKAKCQGINCDEYQARFSQENNRKQTCIVYRYSRI